MNNFIENILSYNVKDRLFRFIFGSQERKEWTLSLYNAIYNTDYKDAEELTLTTINDGIYMSLKNDLSFLYADTMTFIEHQSLPTSSITIRMLFYMVQVYSKYLKDTNQIRKLYNMIKVELPTPNFIVFYNGKKDMEEKVTYKLSDSFKIEGMVKAELIVDMFNINSSKNSALFEKSKYLREYSQFIASLQSRIEMGYNVNKEELKEAVKQSIEELPEGSELKELLIRNCEGVTGMIFDEITLEDIIEARAEEAAEMAAEEAAAKAAAKATAESRVEIAKSMYKDGFSLETISKYTKIPVEELKKLKS